MPLFSGYLVWRQRARLGALVPQGGALGLPVLLAGLTALLRGDLVAELFLMRSSPIVVLAGLVLFHLGPPVFRVVLFPLAFLFFMVPLPAILFYAITFPLQSLAAQQAAWALDLLGVPVMLDGNVILLSQLTLGVTEACSGIRSLISLLGGAVAWAYLALPGGGRGARSRGRRRHPERAAAAGRVGRGGERAAAAGRGSAPGRADADALRR